MSSPSPACCCINCACYTALKCCHCLKVGLHDVFARSILLIASAHCSLILQHVFWNLSKFLLRWRWNRDGFHSFNHIIFIATSARLKYVDVTMELIIIRCTWTIWMLTARRMATSLSHNIQNTFTRPTASSWSFAVLQLPPVFCLSKWTSKSLCQSFLMSSASNYILFKNTDVYSNSFVDTRYRHTSIEPFHDRNPSIIW